MAGTTGSHPPPVADVAGTPPLHTVGAAIFFVCFTNPTAGSIRPPLVVLIPPADILAFLAVGVASLPFASARPLEPLRTLAAPYNRPPLKSRAAHATTCAGAGPDTTLNLASAMHAPAEHALPSSRATPLLSPLVPHTVVLAVGLPWSLMPTPSRCSSIASSMRSLPRRRHSLHLLPSASLTPVLRHVVVHVPLYCVHVSFTMTSFSGPCSWLYIKS